MTGIGVALLGCGVVGSQVPRLLDEPAGDLAARVGAPVELRGVAVRRPHKHPDIPAELLTTDATALVARNDVDVVVEVIGGIEPARALLTGALAAGRAVVTANKALLAEDGAALHDAAAEGGADGRGRSGGGGAAAPPPAPGAGPASAPSCGSPPRAAHASPSTNSRPASIQVEVRTPSTAKAAPKPVSREIMSACMAARPSRGREPAARYPSRLPPENADNSMPNASAPCGRRSLASTGTPTSSGPVSRKLTPVSTSTMTRSGASVHR